MKKNGCIIDKSGNKSWWVDGKLHRTDGPAVENVDGTKQWYLNGHRHRTDGPAVEYVYGDKEWWVDGNQLGYNDKGFWKLWELLTDEQRNNLDLLLHLPSVVRP